MQSGMTQTNGSPEFPGRFSTMNEEERSTVLVTKITEPIVGVAPEKSEARLRLEEELRDELYKKRGEVLNERHEISLRRNEEMACPRISVHLVKRIPLVSHTPSDSHIPASSGGVWDCKTAQYN